MANKFRATIKRIYAAHGIWALLILGAMICYASLAVLWLGDDVDYGQFIHTTIWDSSGELSSVRLFFFSQGNHYAYVNGRFVAHVFVQLFCGVLGQTAFAICNALVYCVFICLVARISGIRRPICNLWVLSCIAALTLVIFVTKMMPSTQIGFVWMFCLTMLWVPGLRRRGGIVFGAGMFLLGIVAGNGQEALSIGMFGALGLWIIHRRFRVRKVTWFAIAGYWIGTLSNCLSPGTLSRTETITIPISDSLFYLTVSLRAVYLMLAVCVWACATRRTTWRQIWRNNALFINALWILIAFNLVIGIYSNRQLFGAELMALLITLRVLPRHRLGKALTIAAIVAAISLFGIQLLLAGEVRRQFRSIERATIATVKGGTVYHNRTMASTNPWLREFRYYEDIVGQGFNDTHHSLQKLLKSHGNYKESPIITPEALSIQSNRRDTVISYAPNHWLVILRNDRQRRTTQVQSHNQITGATSTDTLPYHRPVRRGVNWDAYLVVPSRPFELPDSVYLRQ